MVHHGGGVRDAYDSDASFSPSDLEDAFDDSDHYLTDPETVGTESDATGKTGDLEFNDDDGDMPDIFDSDVSSYLSETDGVFDDKEPHDSENETIDTDLEDICTSEKPSIDINDDQLELYDGNVYPPEYYRQGIRDFNESVLDEEHYSPGSRVLLHDLENKWHR
jgi:hypothetical protein